MKPAVIIASILTVALLGVFFLGSGPREIAELINHKNAKGHEHALTVYKSPTCGCCANWISYMQTKGYKVTVVDTNAITEVKRQKGIPESLDSCHTTVVNNDQYFIEGHIPEEAIVKLLEDEPDISGIGMPGMPSASPGMPGAKLEPFNIMQVNKSGDVSNYMTI